MIKIKQKGEFSKTIRFLKFIYKQEFKQTIDEWARKGVEVLAASTPKDTGITSSSWGYDVKYGLGKITVEWYNTNTTEQVPIVILIQYGHATREGWYLQGTDFINPAMKPIFDGLSDAVWKEVVNA